jgi:hypothetical protein
MLTQEEVANILIVYMPNLHAYHGLQQRSLGTRSPSSGLSPRHTCFVSSWVNFEVALADVSP